MQHHIENTRRRLGELAAMARQTEDAERKIMARAQELLSTLEKNIGDVRDKAKAGDSDAQNEYMDMIHERGRLHRVIATAQRALGSA